MFVYSDYMFFKFVNPTIEFCKYFFNISFLDSSIELSNICCLLNVSSPSTIFRPV